MLLQYEEQRKGWIRATFQSYGDRMNCSPKDHSWIRPRQEHDEQDFISRVAKRLDPTLEWEVKEVWLRPLNGDLQPAVATHPQSSPFWLATPIAEETPVATFHKSKAGQKQALKMLGHPTDH